MGVGVGWWGGNMACDVGSLCNGEVATVWGGHGELIDKRSETLKDG